MTSLVFCEGNGARDVGFGFVDDGISFAVSVDLRGCIVKYSWPNA